MPPMPISTRKSRVSTTTPTGKVIPVPDRRHQETRRITRGPYLTASTHQSLCMISAGDLRCNLLNLLDGEPADLWLIPQGPEPAKEPLSRKDLLILAGNS